MNGLVIAFAGATGSGKTELSSTVSQRLGWPRVGFGDYVRQVARRQGLDESREVLQEVGALLVEQGARQLCQAVLSHGAWSPGQPLIIDGVRHVEVLYSLREIVAPSDLRLVFIAIDDSIRLSRLHGEGCTGKDYLTRVDAHSTERQVRTTLADRADLVVDGSKAEEELVGVVLSWIHKWGVP